MLLFSIVTITFNNRGGLVKPAASILSQTYQDFEWIIIDGNSTDGTQEDFIHYSKATIISEPDQGIYEAMNKGIERGTGNYIIFMNAGDVFADNDVLKKIEPYLSQRPDFLYGDSYEGGHLKKARDHNKINWGMFTHHQAMFYHRKALGNLRYNINYKIAADYDLTLRFLKTAKNVIYLPIPICIFEIGGVSQTNATLGRNEQFLSRQKNRSCSTIKNQAIRLGQIIRYKLRQLMPSFYWFLSKD